MLEPDVVIYTNDISFKPSLPKNANTYFEYIAAVDYENTLVDLVIKDATRMDEPLKIERLEGSKLFHKSLTTYNETDFNWYRIEITDMLKYSRDGIVHLEVKEYHKRRRTPFPEAIPLKSVQTMEFFDS